MKSKLNKYENLLQASLNVVSLKTGKKYGSTTDLMQQRTLSLKPILKGSYIIGWQLKE